MFSLYLAGVAESRWSMSGDFDLRHALRMRRWISRGIAYGCMVGVCLSSATMVRVFVMKDEETISIQNANESLLGG